MMKKNVARSFRSCLQEQNSVCENSNIHTNCPVCGVQSVQKVAPLPVQ